MHIHTHACKHTLTQILGHTNIHKRTSQPPSIHTHTLQTSSEVVDPDVETELALITVEDVLHLILSIGIPSLKAHTWAAWEQREEFEHMSCKLSC